MEKKAGGCSLELKLPRKSRGDISLTQTCRITQVFLYFCKADADATVTKSTMGLFYLILVLIFFCQLGFHKQNNLLLNGNIVSFTELCSIIRDHFSTVASSVIATKIFFL